jgi:hypothetical protein
MTTPHALGRVAFLSAALWLPFGTPPAAADEVLYLMYIKGTEGKTVPFRVLWDQRDDANGRITVDLGLGYEGFLKKLGLARVQAFDAKLNRGDFVVRDPELARFVKMVVTELVRPPEQASVTGSAAATAPEPEVKGAVLLITPAADKTQLEVIARLHVTYAPRQKSGPPIVKDFVNGDLTFVGQPEPKAPSQKTR